MSISSISDMHDRKIYRAIEGIANEGSRFDKYLKCLDGMYRTFYNIFDEQIVRKLPEFNGHGVAHIGMILWLLDGLLCKHLELLEDKEHVKTELAIFCDNLFILIAATIWHDVALEHGRKGHGVRLINDNTYFLKLTINLQSAGFNSQDSNFLAEQILKVAAAHSCGDTFMHCPTDNTHTFWDRSRTSIATKCLAGLLRLCDELSDDKQRVSIADTGNIPDYVCESSEIFWEHSLCIVSSTIESDERKGTYARIEYHLPTSKKDTTYKVEDDNGNLLDVPLYNFIINRIRKVLAEMGICCTAFYKYAKMNDLEVVIRYIENNGSVPVERSAVFQYGIGLPQCKYWDDISGTGEHIKLGL